jgi:predicted nucleic acid-binding protein
MILLDTNILIASKQAGRLEYESVTKRLAALIENNEELIICPQSIYEFYVVSTRPENKNGFGMTCAQALAEIKDLHETYTFMNDPFDLFDNWHQLIKQYNTVAKPAHDCRLVAFMQAHKIDRMYTLNHADFKRYNDIIKII